MLGRGLLTVTGLVAALAGSVRAENLDAGKNAPALFAASCVACHRGPQGLARDRSPRALAGFLLQHYTSGPSTASELAAYLLTPNIARGRASRPSEEASQTGVGRAAREGAGVGAGVSARVDEEGCRGRRVVAHTPILPCPRPLAVMARLEPRPRGGRNASRRAVVVPAAP